jgi:hypothetical protein
LLVLPLDLTLQRIGVALLLLRRVLV